MVRSGCLLWFIFLPPEPLSLAFENHIFSSSSIAFFVTSFVEWFCFAEATFTSTTKNWVTATVRLLQINAVCTLSSICSQPPSEELRPTRSLSIVKMTQTCLVSDPLKAIRGWRSRHLWTMLDSIVIFCHRHPYVTAVWLTSVVFYSVHKLITNQGQMSSWIANLRLWLLHVSHTSVLQHVATMHVSQTDNFITAIPRLI